MLVPLFILTTIIIYYLVRDIFHPAFILMFFWTMGFILLFILPSFYFPSLEIQMIIYGYLIVFVIFSLLTSFMIKKDSRSLSLNHKKIDTKAMMVISFILYIGLIIYLYRYIEVIISFDSLAEYFYRVRYAAIHTNEPLVITGRLLTQVKTFSIIFSLVLMYEVYRNNLSKYYKLYLLTFIILVLSANIIEGSRNEFVILFLSYMSLYIYINGTKSIVKVVITFLTLFFIISIYTRGIGADSFEEAIIKFFEHIVMYGFGSIISFETYLENSNNIQIFSSIMIKLTNKINNLLDLYSINLHFQHPELEQTGFAYVSDDMRTNVYSFLSVRITYFGFVGAIISIIVHSLIITIIYKLKDNNIILFIIYILMISTTVLTLFHEYFFALVPYYIRTVLLVGFLYYTNFYQILVVFLKGRKDVRNFRIY